MKRQEQKFFLNFEEISSILSFFNATMVHPVRTVNSIYFDTDNHRFYHEGEEGSVPREKYRFRWYGDSSKIRNKGQIEIKKTFDNYKTKESVGIRFNNFSQVKSAINSKCNDYLYPICQVSYERLYYANKSGLRFTYDYNIQFKNFLQNNFLKSHNNIFEVKYENINNSLFPSLLGDKMTRFSKYNEALATLFEMS